jgi:hypothetical protein
MKLPLQPWAWFCWNTELNYGKKSANTTTGNTCDFQFSFFIVLFPQHRKFMVKILDHTDRRQITCLMLNKQDGNRSILVITFNTTQKWNNELFQL